MDVSRPRSYPLLMSWRAALQRLGMGVFATIALGGCWAELRLGDPDETSGAGGDASTASSTSSTAVVSVSATSSTSGAGGGGGGTALCDPLAETPGHFYSMSAESLDIDILEPVNMCQYRGDVLLIVNTASQCSYTPQYEQLQELADNATFKMQGFRVLGFINDDFHTAAGTIDDINACNTYWQVTFEQFSQIIVDPLGKEWDGSQDVPYYDPPETIHPIFGWLTSQPPPLDGPVTFNFNKFLVSRDGVLLGRWDEDVLPTDDAIKFAIESAL